MGIATSLMLMAIGSMLTWGVHLHSSGVDINAIGAILVGVAVGRAALSAGFWNIDGRRPGVEQHEIL